MKKTICLKLCLVMLIICGTGIQLNGQTRKTHSAEMCFTQLFPSCKLTDQITVNLTAYYDDNDNDVYHGPFSAKHLRNLNANGVVGKLEYTSSGKYADGKLEGALSITIAETFSRPYAISMKKTLVASYKNGVPTGKWTASELGTLGGEKVNYSITANYEDGEITALSTSKGSSVTFEFIGTEKSWQDQIKIYTVSGKWGEKTYVKGVDNSVFIRKNGNISKLDDEVKALLDDYAKGKITESELIQKGYIKERYDDITEGIFEYWDELLGISGAWNAHELSIIQYDKGKGGFRYRTGNTQLHKYYSYRLRRVNLTPAETVIEALDQRDPSKEHLKTYREYVSANHFDVYYFDDAAKAKIIEHIDKKIAEITRLESLRDSLCNQVMAFIEKYESKEYLLDEIKSFVESFKDDFYYYGSSYDRSVDPAKLDEYQALLPLFEEICQTTIDLYQGKEDIIAQTKSNYPEIATTYAKIFNSYDDKYKSPVSSGSTYLQQIKEWRKTQLITSEYIALMPIIDANHQKILTLSNSKIVKLYKAAKKGVNYAFTTEVQNSLDKAKAWEAKQDEYLELDSLIKTTIKNDAQIAEIAGKDFADVQKNHATYRKKNPVEITSDIAAAIQGNKQIIDVQNTCLNFLSERVKIFDTNARLLEKGKACKNILKVYATYMKTIDLTWTESADIQKLLDVENIQAKFEKAISRPDAAQLEKTVKKSKDKTLEKVLNIIGQ